MRWLLTVFPLLLLTSLAGSGCVPYSILKQSGPPSALVGKSSFQVEDDFANVMMGRKTEAQYLEGKDAETVASWNGDKEGMLGSFIVGMQKGSRGTLAVGPAGSAEGVTVKVHWDFIEVGAYTVMVNVPSRVRARVEFFVDGESKDEIQIETQVNATMSTAASGLRLRLAAEQLGSLAARYLRDVNK